MKHTIWTSDFNVEDFDLDPEFYDKDPSTWTEDEKWKYCNELNDEYLYDERANLRECKAPYGILAIIDQGLWNGRRTVYRFIKSTSVAACLAWIDGEYYCDSYNFRAAVHHHDGTNYITFRALKPGITRRLQDRIWDCQIAGKTLTKSDISKYTTSLQPQIADVYGWPQFKPHSKKQGKKISAA